MNSLKKQDYILFMIKDNVDNTLDIMRKIYINTINNIYTEYERIKQETEDPNCKLIFSVFNMKCQWEERVV